MKENRLSYLSVVCVLILWAAAPLAAQTRKSSAATPPAPRLTTPQQFFGFAVGADYQEIGYDKALEYWKKLASESDRLRLVDMGPTEEGRRQYMAIITSPANLKNLEHSKQISQKLARAEGLTDDEAHALAREGKAVVWIDGGLHASESVGFQQLVELIYQMASDTDPETMRLLNDDILLAVAANPDGSEFVADWYMREPDPSKRSDVGLPRLYNKYIGHDDNRDSYMSNMKETANMNRQLFIEWFPQIMYNHHQTGPAGGVIFMPPFRDPFNYNFDPLIPLEIEAVGTAMHERLVSEGKGGSEMRSGSNYSTWWDGGLRTTVYFHNMVGILTEIIGNPTPINIPLVPQKQLPTGDWPLPIAPTTGDNKWHYRTSVDYEIENDRAILDYASRNREPLLYNIYVMGERSIQNGSEDHWTITPKSIEALNQAAAQQSGSTSAGGRGGRGGRGGAVLAGGDMAGGGMVTAGPAQAPNDLYNTVLHSPADRDARVYIISSDQPDFPTATKFVNALLKNGIEVYRATAAFEASGKSYPAGSFVVRCAQAARPFVLDMFEPQHHPNDFRYPGGPPIPPYDIAGWTLAYQMGVDFDRLFDGVDGPFQKLPYEVQPMPEATVSGAAHPTGYLISHQINNSFIEINRLLKAHCEVYWLKNPVEASGKTMGPGSIWVPASPASTPIVQQAAKELGVGAVGLTAAPSGETLKLKPVRIALYDQYGGLMPAGWTRWLFEQYEFPFERVYPQTLDAGNLKDKFDVLVLTDGAFRAGGGGGRGGGGFGGNIATERIPEEYRGWVGRITAEKTVPQIKQFVEAGGTVVTIGSSTTMAAMLGVPLADYLTEMGSDGKPHPLPGEKFYIPGSLMRVTIDNSVPLAYGMPATADVDFDSSPVYRIVPSAAVVADPVAWFTGTQTLDSGWAWGQAYLDGGTAIAQSRVGRGLVIVLGPEVAFRGQPHGTFKFLFNGVYCGSLEESGTRSAAAGGSK
jgi:Zinc carboxypeptidase